MTRDDILILNQNYDPDRDFPHDVEVFENVAAAELYLEPWFVDEIYILVQPDGTFWELVSPEDTQKTEIAPKSGAAKRPDLARTYLEYALECSMADAFARGDVRSADIQELDTDELVAYWRLRHEAYKNRPGFFTRVFRQLSGQ
jgi:hypothetical protein